MPTYSYTGHALQFGNSSPTVTIVGTDTDGYIIYDMSLSGTFYQFAPNTKYFALQVIFDVPFVLTPGVTLSPANTITAAAITAIPGLEFYVDQSDVTTSSFKISGISTSTPLLGPQVLVWVYQVGGQQIGLGGGSVTSITAAAPLTGGIITTTGTIGIPKATSSVDGYLAHGDWTTFNSKLSSAVTSVATTSRLTGGPITTTGTLDLAVSGVTAGTKNGLTFDAYGRVTATPSGHLTADGYTIDLSGSAYDGYTLSYSTANNKFLITSNVIYWDGYVTWDQVYARLLNSIIDYTTTPVVIVDGSFSQTIPAGTYNIDAISNAFFFSPDYGRIVVNPGVTFSGSFLYLSLHGVSMVASGPLTSSGTSVTVVLQGYGHLSNSHVTNALFPQVPTGAELAIRNTSLDSRPSASDMSAIGTSGGVVFDLAAGANLNLDITGAPGGLTGIASNRAVIGGAGTVTVKGDGMSIYTIDSTNLTGTTAFTSGYPLAYNQKLRVDGYKFDLTGGVTNSQTLQYNGTAFVPATPVQFGVAQTFTKSQNVASFALTDAATINTDASQSNVFTVTLTAAGRTLANPTNLVAGGTYLWIIRQDSGGSKTITTYGGLFKFPGGTAPTLTTSANAVDMISAVYDGIQLSCVFQADFR